MTGKVVPGGIGVGGPLMGWPSERLWVFDNSRLAPGVAGGAYIIPDGFQTQSMSVTASSVRSQSCGQSACSRAARPSRCRRAAGLGIGIPAAVRWPVGSGPDRFVPNEYSAVPVREFTDRRFVDLREGREAVRHIGENVERNVGADRKSCLADPLIG